MKNNYLYRWLRTIGLYGNSKQEAVYPIYRVDSEGQKQNGASRYTLRFAPDQLPPVHAFWSLTMYEPSYAGSCLLLGKQKGYSEACAPTVRTANIVCCSSAALQAAAACVSSNGGE